MSLAATVRKPIGVRATPEQHRILTEAAAREHRSVSSFVLTAALTAAQTSAKKPRKSREELQAILSGLREEFRTLHPDRDPLAEFLTERREAAERE